MNTIQETLLIEQYLASHTVTKCPTRHADGADSLENWAKQRAGNTGFGWGGFKKSRRPKMNVRKRR